MNQSPLRRQGGFAEISVLIIALVVLAGAGFYAFKNYQNKNNAPASASVVRHVPVISKVDFASELDTTGAAKTPATLFAPNTPAINAVVTLSNAGKKARIEYVRYLNDKYVDSGSLQVSKTETKNAGFAFKLKPGAARPVGSYKVKFYANGKFIRQAIYAVK